MYATASQLKEQAMSRPKLIHSLSELYDSTAHFDGLIREGFDDLKPSLQRVVQNAFSHTRSFIVFPRPDGGGYFVGFSKFVGHQMKDIAAYDKIRNQISGSDSERAINALGVATDYALGNDNNGRRAPAAVAQAVRDFIGIAGKKPNSLSWIRLMPLPEEAEDERFNRSKTYEVLLAAMKAAHLTRVEREHLFAEAAA